MSRRRSSITFSTADNLKLWQCGVQQTERKEDLSVVAMLSILTFDSAPTGSAPTRDQIGNQWVSKRFKAYVCSTVGEDAYQNLDDENNEIQRKNKSPIEKRENQQKRKKKKQMAKEEREKKKQKQMAKELKAEEEREKKKQKQMAKELKAEEEQKQRLQQLQRMQQENQRILQQQRQEMENALEESNKKEAAKRLKKANDASMALENAAKKEAAKRLKKANDAMSLEELELAHAVSKKNATTRYIEVKNMLFRAFVEYLKNGKFEDVEFVISNTEITENSKCSAFFFSAYNESDSIPFVIFPRGGGASPTIVMMGPVVRRTRHGFLFINF